MKRRKERITEEKEFKKFFQQYTETFSNKGAYIKHESQYHKKASILDPYMNKRQNYSTYAPTSGKRGFELEEEIKPKFNMLYDLNKKKPLEFSNVEFLGVVALTAEVDYEYGCGLMFHPTPLSEIEEKILNHEQLVFSEIINTLTLKNDVSPFELEVKINQLYHQFKSTYNECKES